MHKAEKKLAIILKKSATAGISPDELLSLKVLKDFRYGNYFKFDNYKYLTLKIAASIVFIYFLSTVIMNYNSDCLINMPIDTSKIFRKSENCDFCLGVKEVKRVKNISKSKFEELYAHTGTPVVVIDGAANWPATNKFNFDFFKGIYSQDANHSGSANECQFFPYKTGFQSLRDVFNMSAERAAMKPGYEPWYVGWSNCNDKAGQILRKYYNQPYFLPDTSENIALSWIFMGTPGNGAHLHVDNVVHPSWQAQLNGKKTWRLFPPPECYYQCTEISVTVHPNEIIVVDTNKWYHQTIILDGDISITIGSEFD